MLMLTLDLQLGPGRKPLPVHLGGVLHGFVEGGVKDQAPHLLSVLRPDGPNQFAQLTIQAPPLGANIESSLRFGIILYGNSARAWPVLLRALLEQQANGLNGRHARIVQASLQPPVGDAYLLVEKGRLLESVDQTPLPRNADSLAASTPASNGTAALYRLTFRSPLLLASRKAQRDRDRIANGLPWPTLGSILNSIAARMRFLEPELADALHLSPEWSAPLVARQVAPMTSAERPAQQIVWEYSATPRSVPTGEESLASVRRTFLIPGIVGDLIYPATGVEQEHSLLYWGQWLGVGQKTTMGCGSYTLTCQ